ncbi:MAG: hypothetical protein ACQEUI_07840 [Actinomycetota bacterium]
MATGRGIVAGSVGAVTGCALGGGLGWLVYRWLDPFLEGRGGPLEELQGLVSTVVLVGGGVGLAAGCILALRLRGHGSAALTAILVLAVVPFATPLVALAGALGWPAALVAGALLVSGAVAGVRLLVTRTVEVGETAASERDVTGR